jgi:hypothetical protein
MAQSYARTARKVAAKTGTHESDEYGDRRHQRSAAATDEDLNLGPCTAAVTIQVSVLEACPTGTGKLPSKSLPGAV